LEVHEGDAVPGGEIHGFIDACLAAEMGIADETSREVVREVEGADAGGDGDGWMGGGFEGDFGGGARVGDGACLGQPMIDDDRGEAEIVHGTVELLVTDEIEESVEGGVVGDEGDLADLMGDGDVTAVEIGGVVGLGKVAGEERSDFEGDECEVGAGVEGLEKFDGLEGGDGGAEFDGAGGVEVFGVHAVAVALEAGRVSGGVDDFGDEDLESEIRRVGETGAEGFTAGGEEGCEIADGFGIHGGATGTEQGEQGAEDGKCDGRFHAKGSRTTFEVEIRASVRWGRRRCMAGRNRVEETGWDVGTARGEWGVDMEMPKLAAADEPAHAGPSREPLRPS